MTYPSRRRKAEIHAAEIERLTKERDALREVIATGPRCLARALTIQIRGVSRDVENPDCLLLAFNRKPSDDDMRVIHEGLRHDYEEISAPTDMEGETYKCRNCGDWVRLYYEDMK